MRLLVFSFVGAGAMLAIGGSVLSFAQPMPVRQPPAQGSTLCPVASFAGIANECDRSVALVNEMG